MGIQILNKDVSVISSIAGTPKASIGNLFGKTGWVGAIGGVPFVPGDFNFADTTANPHTSNTVTFTKSGTLYIYGTSDGNKDWAAAVYLNGSATPLKSHYLAANAITYKQTGVGSGTFMYHGAYIVVDVNVGNTMYFTTDASGPPVPTTGTITFSINNFSNNGGTVIDTFTNTVTGCYLTTATVQYKGLLDDGVELTAMRALREHYRGDTYYDNLIAEYYQSSVAIIQGIDNSVNPSIDYEFIYQSVLKVKDFVDQSMWEEAKEEYVSTYLTLKNKYITNV
jgi:hypothetical protein